MCWAWGWAVGLPPDQRPTWDEYEALAKVEHHGKNGEQADLVRVRFLHSRMHARDLIWTRDTRGKYYLAKVATSVRAPTPRIAWPQWRSFPAAGSATTTVHSRPAH
jgi:hypothetical protein